MKFMLKKDKNICGVYYVSYPNIFNGMRSKYYFKGNIKDLINHIKNDIVELENLFAESKKYFEKYPNDLNRERKKDLNNIEQHKTVLSELIAYLNKKEIY